MASDAAERMLWEGHQWDHGYGRKAFSSLRCEVDDLPGKEAFKRNRNFMKCAKRLMKVKSSIPRSSLEQAPKNRLGIFQRIKEGRGEIDKTKEEKTPGFSARNHNRSPASGVDDSSPTEPDEEEHSDAQPNDQRQECTDRSIRSHRNDVTGQHLLKRSRGKKGLVLNPEDLEDDDDDSSLSSSFLPRHIRSQSSSEQPIFERTISELTEDPNQYVDPRHLLQRYFRRQGASRGFGAFDKKEEDNDRFGDDYDDDWSSNSGSVDADDPYLFFPRPRNLPLDVTWPPPHLVAVESTFTEDTDMKRLGTMSVQFSLGVPSKQSSILSDGSDSQAHEPMEMNHKVMLRRRFYDQPKPLYAAIDEDHSEDFGLINLPGQNLDGLSSSQTQAKEPKQQLKRSLGRKRFQGSHLQQVLEGSRIEEHVWDPSAQLVTRPSSDGEVADLAATTTAVVTDPTQLNRGQSHGLDVRSIKPPSRPESSISAEPIPEPPAPLGSPLGDRGQSLGLDTQPLLPPIREDGETIPPLPPVLSPISEGTGYSMTPPCKCVLTRNRSADTDEEDVSPSPPPAQSPEASIQSKSSRNRRQGEADDVSLLQPVPPALAQSPMSTHSPSTRRNREDESDDWSLQPPTRKISFVAPCP